MKKQARPISNRKVAVLFDPLYKFGGAELHLRYILETFPQAELFVPYYDKEFVKKNFPNIKIHHSFLQYLPWKDSLKYIYLLLQPLAISTYRFKGFEAIVSLSIQFGKFAKGNIKHVNICMSPPKFLWQKDDRSIKDVNSLKGINRLFFRIYSFFMDSFLEDMWKKWDARAAQRLDGMVAISNVVKRRIKKFYDVKAEVMYPPVEIEKLKPKKLLKRKENWFLYLGRIETYKGVELAIRACVEAGVPLKVAGTGADVDRMKDLIKELNAKGLVKMLGFIDEELKYDLLRRCKALIFPVRGEDFGIVPVEANACGSVVIAYKDGGVVETISDVKPKTGIFFTKYNYKELAKILKKFDADDYEPTNCIIQAENFDAKIFMYKLKNYVEDMLQSS
jgi:glycosyltransferase involved in cell wall biosynthesis